VPTRRASPQRYQLSKRAAAVVASGHPWIFRGLVSSAAAALADGQWLTLFDGGNQAVGHGVYAAEGAIAIRVPDRDLVVPRVPLSRSRPLLDRLPAPHPGADAPNRLRRQLPRPR
jgi:hypothetical protein